jgi:hypothetical protein
MAATADLIVRVVTDTSKAKGLDETATKTSKFSKGLQTASKVAAGALVAVGAAAIGAAKAAAEDAASQDALAQSMVKNTGANKDQIAATEDWISKMSMATGVADDEMRPALATLVRATGDVQKSQEAMAVAMDVSAATGKPLGAITEAMAKGYAGQTTALGRLVPGLSKAALKSGDMGRIMDELKDKTGGAAKAAGETAAGKFQRFKVSLDETQEAAGAVLLPALMKLMNILVPLGNWAQNHGTMFSVIAGGVAALAAAILVLNVALKIYNTTMAIVKIVTTTTWIAALGPIALVILAVLAVVAVIVILWKKSETFRRIVLGVWAAIKSAALAVGRAISVAWRAVFNALSTAVRAFVTVFRVAFTAVRTVVSAVVSYVKGVWHGLWSALSGMVRAFVGTFRDIFRGIQDAARNVMDAVQSAWNTVMGGLAAVVEREVRGITRIFDAVRDAVDHVISAVQSLIGWLGKIKVPKISLPHIPGLNAAAAPPVTMGATGFGAYAAPRVRGISPQAAGTGGGVVINVNGALDPEGVARQINRILGGHDRRVGRVA